jgi:hypothetical protein
MRGSSRRPIRRSRSSATPGRVYPLSAPGRPSRVGVPAKATVRAAHPDRLPGHLTGTPATPRHAREPIDMPASVRTDLQAGRLQQCCPGCGRWEAAHWYCSFCFRVMGPADWFRGSKTATEDRAARMPKSRPANPAPEYLDRRDWPTAWGPFPEKAPRPPHSLVGPEKDPIPHNQSIWPDGLPAAGVYPPARGGESGTPSTLG